MKQILITVLIILSGLGTYAQPQIYFIPSISLGYVFTGKGFSYGLDIDIVKKTTIRNKTYLYGITLSKYWTKVKFGKKRDIHRHRTFCFMVASENIDLKLGTDNIRNPWGYGGKRNRCTTTGLTFDISLTMPGTYIPFAGIKNTVYYKPAWAWFDKPYSTFYLKYKHDFYNTGVKK